MNDYAGNWNEMPWRVIRPGIEQAVIASGAQQMTATIGRVYNDAQIRPHAHPNEQVAIILEGCCDYHVGDACCKLKEGDWLVIPSNEQHYIHVYESPCPCLVLEVFAPRRPAYVEEYRAFVQSAGDTAQEGGDTAL